MNKFYLIAVLLLSQISFAQTTEPQAKVIFGNQTTKITFEAGTAAFLGNQQVTKGIQDLSAAQQADLVVEEIQSKKVSDQKFLVCILLVRLGGDAIAAAGAVKGEVEVVKLGGRGGTAYKVSSVVADPKQKWDLCNTYGIVKD